MAHSKKGQNSQPSSSVTVQRAHQSSRGEYDYHVMLHADGSTKSMELPLESYSTGEGAAVGAWVLIRGRATGGCEEVGTGPDSKCSQRGTFSLVGVKVVRVGPRSAINAFTIHVRSTYTSYYILRTHVRKVYTSK